MSQKGGRNSTSKLLEAVRKGDTHWLLHLLKGTTLNQEELDEALHAAAWMGQNDGVRMLLAAGASLKSVSQHCEPLLVVAVYSGSVEVVRTIIQAGYDLSSISGDSTEIPNPIHLAISRNSSNYEMIDLLLEYKLDPESKDVDGDTALIVACNMGDIQLAKKFLSAKCQVDSTGYEKNTALHRAVESGSVELVDLLLGHKANIHARNSTGNTPLMVACANGNDSLATKLLTNAGNGAVQETNDEGKNCFHMAAISGNIALIPILMEAGVSYRDGDLHHNTPLVLSTVMKNPEFAHRLLDFITQGTDAAEHVTIQGGLARSALHWAAIHDTVSVVERLITTSGTKMSEFINLRDVEGDSALILAVKAKSRQTSKLLIKQNCNANICGELGRTALHWILHSSCDGEIIEDILSAPGLDLNILDQMGNSPLTLAALSRRYDEVLRLARHGGGDLNTQGEQGRTVLHWLSHAGQADLIRELLGTAAPLDVNIIDDNGDTALLLAIKNKHQTTAVEILTSPSSNWMRQMDLTIKDSSGRQAVHYAAAEGFLDVVQLLLEKGSNVNSCDNDGSTPLVLSIRNKHVPVVLALIGGGSEVDITDNEHRTPLYYAAQTGCMTCVEALLAAGADPDLKRSEPSPLIQAAKIGAKEIVEMLVSRGAGLNYRDAQGRTPVMWAAQGGYSDIIGYLVGQKASARIEDMSGDTALTIAAWNGHQEAVKLLIPLSDLEHQERDEGMTALHLAIAKDNSAIVRTLLGAGSEVNALDSKGNNCLLTAMMHTSGSDIVSIILDECPMIDINFTGDQARSALHWAVGDPECLKMVIERHPDIDLIDSNGASPLLLSIAHSKSESAKILIDAGADFTRLHKDGRAPIHHASIYGATAVVQLLLERGVTPDALTADGKTPLLLASVEGHVDIVRLLIQHGSDINKIYLDATTPLSVASSGRHHRVMEVLLEAGADPNLFGSLKCSPLIACILNNDKEGTAILIQHGAKMDQVIEQDKHPIHGAMVNNYVDILRLLVSVESDVNFLRRLMREGVIYYFVDDDYFLDDLRLLSKTPRTLKLLCRSGIRRRLAIPIVDKIRKLPIPSIIKDYLAMKEIIPQQ